MHRFWLRFILPLLVAASPGRVLEIGAEFGWNTRRLLEIGRERGFFLDIIDPAPHPVFHEMLAEFDGGYAFHPHKSLDALPLIQAADFILLDGDHNWFTVYNELAQIFLRARQAGKEPPIILFHDVAWPYARRDMYYDADAIPDGKRQPYARRGFLPGRSDLVEEGLNGDFANALQEGGPCNGVLTAAEDFIAAAKVGATFKRLPFFNGLGILVPDARSSEAIQQVLAGFFSPESLLATCEELEGDINGLRVELAVSRQTLTRRTEALMRARTIIQEQEQELADAQVGVQA